MGRKLEEVIDGLPVERQARIAALSQEKVAEMIAHASSLTDFRKAVGKTQAEVARELGIQQHAVSQLEKRSDTYVSTLRRFLQSLGMTLELSVVAQNGTRIELRNFLRPPELDADGTPAKKKTAAADKPAAKQ
ncbi:MULTISPECIES: XRE family transcriptional regulator [unclassified Janthinobacterium]|uniref:XRE family transcriptional regulator n=1 Tax=unclassified Janthinobacterium TaxID=2610881 RepID=UPI00160A96C0|nr:MULTISPECIES: XRE family transcriptional regulator [unclassified Janthinobacterium]MBB5369022.1 transcriptional regulator with XRE-family HTH domain [Janthinobacterium sp. K2C7]MBB5381441.1 transcriptional regulator with XRE-family HTH domain [Janthinobacterium sp. K2Li3]MBB5387405.1 transcriptional regulator with XRE-family HTH domain [Janthinobacterium sp. K2E3]